MQCSTSLEQSDLAGFVECIGLIISEQEYSIYIPLSVSEKSSLVARLVSNCSAAPLRTLACDPVNDYSYEKVHGQFATTKSLHSPLILFLPRPELSQPNALAPPTGLDLVGAATLSLPLPG